MKEDREGEHRKEKIWKRLDLKMGGERERGEEGGGRQTGYTLPYA